MKIWCLLCFKEEEEEEEKEEAVVADCEDKPVAVMEGDEGIFGIEGIADDYVGNGEENENSLALSLPVSVPGNGGDEGPPSLGLSLHACVNSMRSLVGGLWNIHGGANYDETVIAFPCSRRVEGESSGSSAAVAAGDSQHKRAKVQYGSQ